MLAQKSDYKYLLSKAGCLSYNLVWVSIRGRRVGQKLIFYINEEIQNYVFYI